MDQTPEDLPTSLEFSEPVQGPVRGQGKRRYLVLLSAWMLFMGFVIGAMSAESETLLSFLDAVVTIVLLVKWIYLDAEEHGVRLHRHFVLMMVFCPGPLILIPIHFIRSRGWLQGSITTAKAILIFCLLMALKIGAATLAETIFWGQ